MIVAKHSNHPPSVPLPSELDQEVREAILSKLSEPVDFGDKDNLLSLGLDSLKIMRLVSLWRKQGFKVTFAELMEAPRLTDWLTLLGQRWEDAGGAGTSQPEADKANPFPLTDAQYAYWVGRKDGQPLGGVGCHAYLELDGDGVDPARLDKAWQKVRAGHPMLRASFLPDGTQVVDGDGKAGSVVVHDLKDAAKDRVAESLENVRRRMSHRRLDIENGQVAGIELSLLPDGKTRLHFDIDLLVADVQSLHIVLRDLAAAYHRDVAPKAPDNWDFAAYLARARKQREAGRGAAKAYWAGQLDALPGAPGLPLAVPPEQLAVPEFKRRRQLFPAKEWECLKALAAGYKVTPAMVLLTAYAEVLNTWSRTCEFLINIPLFDRQAGEDNEIEEVVADFTNLLVLAVDFREEQNFLERLEGIRERFYRDAAHSDYSGIQVQRDLASARQGQRMMAPVVFASNLGTVFIGDECRSALGEWSYMISQTPQVWLDFQTYETHEGLVFAWDAVEGLFPEGMVDDMFDAYCRLVHHLARDAAAWNASEWDKARFDFMPVHQAGQRAQVNDTGVPASTDLLHTGFFYQAELYPGREALVTSEKRMTYGELARRAEQVGLILKKRGTEPGDLVAVVMEKGWEQVVAVLGILWSGAAYLPLDAAMPGTRMEKIIRDGDVNIALTQSCMSLSLPDIDRVDVDTVRPGEKRVIPNVWPTVTGLAYVIYTSGSTGDPKGVMIDHQGAVNTILDINRRFEVRPEDCMIGLSELSFDLSVYDIFGVLGAGATLVIPDAQGAKDPSHWHGWLKREHITLWNSVPQLMQMLIECAEGGQVKLPGGLRLAMLSGDWIPVDLPEKIKAHFPEIQVVSLGGATEASIWSILHPVETPAPHCPSIPYGRPMDNQQFYVLDRHMAPCPDWVPGDLYIGGIGLAKGYRKDEEKNRSSFVRHPGTGHRLYKTGDLGRHLPDGNIEFLGREDLQVKIRGYRIELGEIEAAIKQHPDIRDAVVSPVVRTGKETGLAGYLLGWPGGRDTVGQGEYPDTPDPFWDSVTQTGKKACRLLPDADEDGHFQKFWQRLDQVYYTAVYQAFSAMGIIGEVGDIPGPEHVMDSFDILPRYGRWVSRALQALGNHGLIKGGEAVARATAAELDPASLYADIDRIDGFTREVADVICYAARNLPDILRGKIHSAEIYVGDEVKAVYKSLFDPCNQLLGELAGWIGTACGPLRILEAGAGMGTATGHILPQLSGKDTRYYFTDISTYFLKNAEERFRDYPFLTYNTLDLDLDPVLQGYEAGSFDMVVAASMLHDVKFVDTSLGHLRKLLKPGGILLILEETRFHPSFDLHMGLQQGFDRYEDTGIRKDHPLLDGNQWVAHLKKNGFSDGMVLNKSGARAEIMGFDVIMAMAGTASSIPGSADLKAFLSERLPAYMVPGLFMEIDTLPLSANGKVDRKQLPQPEILDTRSGKGTGRPATYRESVVGEIWQTILGADAIGVEDNFFEIGGDSLVATRIVSRICKSFGIELTLPMLFENPTISALSRIIGGLTDPASGQSQDKEKDAVPAQDAGAVVPCPADQYHPFPMTRVQEAYWIGRNAIFELGNTSAQMYCEIDIPGGDTEQVQRAWQALVDRHDMLRAVMRADGSQQVLEQVPAYVFEPAVPHDTSPEEMETALAEIRRAMSGQVIPAETWPLFDIRVSRPSGDGIRLHIAIDALIVDAWSFFLLFDEWHCLVSSPEKELPPLDVSFRDYVVAERRFEDAERFNRDREYWHRRIPLLPPPPELPLAKPLSSIRQPEFSRRSLTLDTSEWTRIKSFAAKQGLTPSCVLLAAYSAVLQNWTRNGRFTLNLTLFNRLPLHQGINSIVGDFTSLTLLAVDGESPAAFEALANQIQRQLWQDIEHRHFSGVHVLREIARNENRVGKALMPVVFTSALSLGGPDGDAASVLNRMGEFVYGLAQTPQVLLDHQVMERQGCLVCNWDAVDEAFPAGMLDDMFQAYADFIHSLAEDGEAWSQPVPAMIPGRQLYRRSRVNDTANLPDGPVLLHELFVRKALARPDSVAIYCSDKTITYRDLDKYARQLAGLLRENGAAPNTLVAVVMEKGWEQVAAVLGVLYAGAAYLPIDAAVPEKRLHHLLEDGQAGIALTQPWLEDRLEWPEGVIRLHVGSTLTDGPESSEAPVYVQTHEDLAYVIHTSGSTGLPKGVMIDHHGAVNTILDVNRRFGIGSNDKVMAVSALNFDLSVFDIFGTLAAGGTIVMPDAVGAKDPAHWLPLMGQAGVTVWNSVPALMQMVVEHSAGSNGDTLDTLRLVMLSGDWIPLDLPEKIRAAATRADIVSLGGATEASIWSILYPIRNIDPEWKSIPYGKPMDNQSFHVLNRQMADCPDWVTGELYIGGTGVARGYWRDADKTGASFIRHPETGASLYRTGDLGRYLPDGNIEFLGREDQQVKINGYRIELGEIESALKKEETVSDAVVVTLKDPQGNIHLAAHLIPAAGEECAAEDLKISLGLHLPEYMVPGFYLPCDAFPVTANGKVDRKTLSDPAGISFRKTSGEYVAPETRTEQDIADMVTDLLGLEKAGVKDVFFDLGATSMDLVKLQNRLNQAFDKKVSIVDIFEYPTIASLAAFIARDVVESEAVSRAESRGERRKASQRRRYRNA
ncbi:MAG: amino acid adenylation domain-containing protein [Desulfobacter sp.]